MAPRASLERWQPERGSDAPARPVDVRADPNAAKNKIMQVGFKGNTRPDGPHDMAKTPLGVSRALRARFSPSHRVKHRKIGEGSRPFAGGDRAGLFAWCSAISASQFLT